MNTSVKKLLGLLVLTMILIIPFNVEAKSYKVVLSYFAQGGKVSSGKIEVYNNIVFEKDGTKADVTYKSTDTVTYINSLDKKTTFTLKKSNKAQAKNKEWYGRKYTDDSKVYFSNAEKYKVTDIIKKLEIDTSIYSEGESIEVFLYANYSNTATSSTDKTTKTDNKTVSVTGVKLNTSSKTINIGETYTLKETITPSNATNKNVTWKSSDTKIATVDSNGKVKGIKEGKATITVTTKDGNKKDDIKVTVTDKKSYYVKIKYNANKGVLADQHGEGLSINSNYIYKNNNQVISKIAYNEKISSSGLANYNNKEYFNIVRVGYKAIEGKEWNTKSDGSGKSYDQSKIYKASDFCDASKSDCEITLYVNWTKDNTEKIHFIRNANTSKVKRDSNGEPTSSTTVSGDTILLESKGSYGLVDVGDADASYRLINYLHKLKVNKIDFVLITHFHPDHMGGLKDLADSDIKIDRVYIKRYSESLPNYGSYYERWKKLVDKLQKKGIQVIITQNIDNNNCPEASNKANLRTNPDAKYCKANIPNLGDMKIKLYNTGYVMKPRDIKAYTKPNKEKLETYNANYESIYSYINVNNKKIVLAADALGSNTSSKTDYFPSDGWWKEIKKDTSSPIDILKIPHHGNFHCDYHFRSLEPKYAVVTYLKVRVEASYMSDNPSDTCISRYKNGVPKLNVQYVDDVINKNKDALVYDLSKSSISYYAN